MTRKGRPVSTIRALSGLPPVDARLKGKKPPAGVEPGVTLERHHALNWLVGYMDRDWDDVTTDT
jgi:hypothetical protein